MIELEIPSDPVAWAAPKKRGDFFYDPKFDEKELIRWLIKSTYKGDLIAEYVVLDFSFFCPIPKSASKKQKMKMLKGEIRPTRFDTTNCQKLYEDCLKKLVITDDRNVIGIKSWKYFSEQGKVIIKIFTLKEYEEGLKIAI